MELVGAYAVFANGGHAVAPHVIERVRTLAGKVRYVRERQDFGRIVDTRPVAMMNAMLQETLRSGTATRANVPGWSAAGKTGTSQDFRDAWFIGYTSHLVTGVWYGNDDGTPTRRMTGGGLPVETWNRVMHAAHHGVPVAGLAGASADAVRRADPTAPPDDLPPGLIPPPSRAAAARTQDRRPDSSIDGWFLERLFRR
jgi:penicillin-binding protein 1A